MENAKELQKTFQKRNFYTLKDSGNIFLYSLLMPLLTAFIFTYLAILIATLCGTKFPEGSNMVEILFHEHLSFAVFSIIITQICFICIYFIFHKASRIQFKASKVQIKKINIWLLLVSALIGIVCVSGLIWLVEGCFGKLFDIMGFKPSGLSLPLDSVGMLFLNILVLAVFPAICEELIFRGIIFQGLRQSYSKLCSIFLCGLLFALIHGNIIQFIYPFILGCIISVVMEKTGNLIYCMIIHFFNNFTIVLLEYLANINVISLSFNVSWWGCLCAILLACATFGILWLLYYFVIRKHKKEEIEIEGELTQKPPYMVGKISLSLLIGIILAAIMIVINAVI